MSDSFIVYSRVVERRGERETRETTTLFALFLSYKFKPYEVPVCKNERATCAIVTYSSLPFSTVTIFFFCVFRSPAVDKPTEHQLFVDFTAEPRVFATNAIQNCHIE